MNEKTKTINEKVEKISKEKALNLLEKDLRYYLIKAIEKKNKQATLISKQIDTLKTILKSIDIENVYYKRNKLTNINLGYVGQSILEYYNGKPESKEVEYKTLIVNTPHIAEVPTTHTYILIIKAKNIGIYKIKGENKIEIIQQRLNAEKSLSYAEYNKRLSDKLPKNLSFRDIATIALDMGL